VGKVRVQVWVVLGLESSVVAQLQVSGPEGGLFWSGLVVDVEVATLWEVAGRLVSWMLQEWSWIWPMGFGSLCDIGAEKSKVWVCVPWGMEGPDIDPAVFALCMCIGCRYIVFPFALAGRDCVIERA